MMKVSGYNSHQKQKIIISSTAPIWAPGPKNPPTKWVLGDLSPGQEADHWSLFNTEVESTYYHIPNPPSVFMEWCLIKYKVSFTSNFTLTVRINYENRKYVVNYATNTYELNSNKLTSFQ